MKFRMITDKKRLMTVEEVATELQTCKETIRRKIKSGKLPAVKYEGRNGRYMIWSDDLENYIKSFYA